MSNITTNSKYLAITILIGGKSTRFGSDKGLFPLFGKPLISHQLDTLSQLKYDIFLVAHSKKQVQYYINKINIKKIMAFIIDDKNISIKIEGTTPLIGMYSAFKELYKLGYAKSLVLPCDLPLIQKKIIELLITQSEKFECCIPQWENGLLEPLFAIYPIEKALNSSEYNLRHKNYKLVNLIDKSWNINYISIEKLIKPLDKNLLSFININSQENLKIIHKKIKKKD
ncbi:MAG: molybdenum cofactor guanylyltransferase [Promethearchaeota archaeon]